MPVLRAISAARLATSWARSCGVVTTTASARGSIWPSEIETSPVPGGMSTNEHVELAPVHVLQELLERAVEHRPPPHQRRVVVDEEPDRHQLQIVLDRRDHQLVDQHRLLADPEHVRDRVAVDVGVEDADLRPCSENAAARLTVSDDFPTPPLPEATAITRVVGSSWIALSSAGRPPRSFVVSAERSSGAHHVELEPHRETPSTAPTSRATCSWKELRSGQPATVSAIVTSTSPPRSGRRAPCRAR